MRYKHLMLGAIILFGLGLSGLQAQEATPASGGNATGSGGTASYSVGQVVYSTHTGVAGSVLEGVQQPFEISLVTETEEIIGINLTIAVFPNPTTDNLTLSIKGNDFSNLFYKIYDMQGKLLEVGNITAIHTAISMTSVRSGIYLVKVVHDDCNIKTFKIIKN